MFITINDRNYPTIGSINEKPLTNADIRDAELERVRHALAYLKWKLGNEAMRTLLNDDLHRMQATVRGWVEASKRRWQSATLRLVVPGPRAQALQDWYTNAMACSREVELHA